MMLKDKIQSVFIKPRHYLNEIVWLIRCNLKPILLFVFFFAAINSLATIAIRDVALSLAMFVRGTAYLGPDNLKFFFFSPSSIIISLTALILFTIMSIFEIAGLLHAYSMSQVGKRTTLLGMVEAGVYACKRSLHPKNWLIMLFILVLLPLTGVLSFSSTSIAAMIPGFIRDFISANNLYNALYFIVYILMLLVEVTFIFMLNFYILEEKSFLTSCKESRHLIKSKYIHTVTGIILASLAFFVVTVSVSAVLSESFIHIQSFLFGSTGKISDSLRMVTIIDIIRDICTGVVAPVINIAAVTVLFYQYVEEEDKLLHVSRRAFNDTPFSKTQILVISFSLLFIFSYSCYDSIQSMGSFHDTLTRPQIAAHRGDSVRAPENSMPAFQLAVLEDVDQIELDIHETKDGVLIISHDDNLARISGQQINVHDLTYEEIIQMDVGSWFSEDYADLRITSLDSFFKFIKEYENILVQVEIKPTEYDHELEEKLISVIRENDMQNRVIVICLELEPLLRIKELDPDITTAYCMYIAWHHIENIDNVDYFTIEESNVTKDLVDGIHKMGKQCFVWTVNSEDNVQHLVDCGVDAILTDDPLMLRNALDNVSYTSGLPRLMRLTVNQLVNGV